MGPLHNGRGRKSRFQSTLPVGGATQSSPPDRSQGDISIHAPRGGSDPAPRWATLPRKFQSTLPVGGATWYRGMAIPQFIFQSTLPVGGATDIRPGNTRRILFQSTLPVGGATGSIDWHVILAYISIHAPRGGSDAQAGRSWRW